MFYNKKILTCVLKQYRCEHIFITSALKREQKTSI